jgi:WD40 repeat protein
MPGFSPVVIRERLARIIGAIVSPSPEAVMHATTLAQGLIQWEDAYRQGRDLSPAELLPERPDLHSCLARAIDALRPSVGAGLSGSLPAAEVTVDGIDRTQAATIGFTTSQPAGQLDVPPGYEVLAELGRGGMAVVYRARQTALDRPCALKMILAGGHAGQAERERFLTEARVIARLRHPGIVQVFEVGEYRGNAFMALELCAGGSLDQRLREKPPTAREAAELVRALAGAMQAAHDASVLHRDLKPANVLIAADGALKITDFGLAKKLDEDGQTHTGAIMGTPSYMPPEQARGEKDLGPTVDVYALGAILYACLTGRPPFLGAVLLETLRQVQEDDPVAVRQLNPSVPRDLETICLKCLRKEPGRRYATARALADDLDRFLNGRPIEARPARALERAFKWVRRNPIVSILAAAVVLVLLAGVAVSSTFAYQAMSEARIARKAEEDASQKATLASLAEQKAETRAKAEAEAKERASDQLKRAERLIYAGKLFEALNAFEGRKGALALQYLDQCQWNLRGWEHDHLWTRFNSVQTLRGHPDPVTGVSWSPDGKRILSVSSKMPVRVWDAATGQVVFSLGGVPNLASEAIWSPDGKRILAAGSTLKILDAETGKELQALSGRLSWENTAPWSPDGKRILIAEGYQTKMWDVEKGQAIQTLPRDDSVVVLVSIVAWSPDGKRVLTTTGAFAKVWAAENGEELCSFRAYNDRITSAVWSPDSKRIATAGNDPTPKVWDADTGQELHALKSRDRSVVTRVAWSPDGTRILGVGHTATMVWDAESGQELSTLQESPHQVFRAAWSPDSRRIATASAGYATVWDANTGKELLILRGHTGAVRCVAWSPDGRRLVTGSGDIGSAGEVRVWDADQGQEFLSLRGHSMWVDAVAWAPDGKRCLTGSLDGTTKVWDAEKGLEVGSIKGHLGSINSVAWSHDGKRLVTGSQDRTVRIWDASNGQELHVLKAPDGSVKRVAWSPEDDRVAIVSSNDLVRIWDPGAGQEVRTLRGHTAPVSDLAWSPDGKRLVTTGGSGKIWDVAQGKELFSLKPRGQRNIPPRLTEGTGHLISASCVAWSPDGKRIATGSRDRAVTVWDAATGAELLTLRGHTAPVTSVAWSPDGERIASTAEDGTLRVWETDKGQELLSLRGSFDYGVAWSPDGTRLLVAGRDNSAMILEGRRKQRVRIFHDHIYVVDRVAWSADGKHLFAWDQLGKVLAWSIETGQLAEDIDTPAQPPPGPATSPDGAFRAEPRGAQVVIIDTRLPEPTDWPLPDAAERKRYHTAQAILAEQQREWFAFAFHVGRLLLDDPGNADLQRRRDEALRNLAPQ